MKNEKKFWLATTVILVLAISSFTFFQHDEGPDLEGQALESRILNGTAEYKSERSDLEDDKLDSTQNKEMEKEANDQLLPETNTGQRSSMRIDLDDIGKLILARKR